MSPETKTEVNVNVKQAVPFFMITDIERSLKFYCEGLGFTVKNQWTPRGKIEWCWLELGAASLMLQEYRPGKVPAGKLGAGVSICFVCRDALTIYREARSRGLEPQRPFVGNGLWVTSFTDPDGYRVDFESPADAPEESVYQEE